MIHRRFAILMLAVASGSVLVLGGRAQEPVPLFEDVTAAAGITYVVGSLVGTTGA